MSRGPSCLAVASACVGLLLLVAVAKADLPVHCLNVQIAGEWIFELSDDNHDSSLRCGHKVPDSNLDHFTKEGFNLEVVQKLKFNLTEPNIVIDSHGNKGTWTMVYDEGFEVRINGKRYFAFSKYVPKTPESLNKDDVEDYISICDETLVGWFHNDDGTHWGCYHGQKVDASSKNHRFRASPKPKQNKQEVKILSPTSFKKQDDNLEQLERDAMFEPDLAFIELVNSNANSLWRAGVSDEFLGKRMSNMVRLLGQRTQASSHGQHKGRRVHVDVSDLPTSFDWRNHQGKNFDSPVKNQGNCGSCYSMASIYVAEARARILSGLRHRPSLSTQEVVSCSIYNQGCDGGYPFLVGKHGYDHGLVPESCFPYSGEDEQCELVRSADCPDPSNPPRYRVTNYTYIGGYYGACSESLMMREIYESGPIMVAFDAPSSLFYYSGGIYTGDAPPHEGPRLPGLRQWEKTNHAVTAIGWGVENGVKYWVIKNTWGAQWGESGYFRIKRGEDECGIESMAVTMHIELPPLV